MGSPVSGGSGGLAPVSFSVLPPPPLRFFFFLLLLLPRDLRLAGDPVPSAAAASLAAFCLAFFSFFALAMGDIGDILISSSIFTTSRSISFHRVRRVFFASIYALYIARISPTRRPPTYQHEIRLGDKTIKAYLNSMDQCIPKANDTESFIVW